MRQATAPTLARRRSSAARTSRGGRLFRAAPIALAALLLARTAAAEEHSPAQGEVEARFLLQLIRYVTWPESALPEASPLVLGVFGDDAFAATLRRLSEGRPAQERPVEVRILTDAASPGVHLLFIRGGDASSLREVARLHYNAPVLTVADHFDFPKLGGDVGLEPAGDRVSFSINRRKSVRGDLVISSKLLRLASDVK